MDKYLFLDKIQTNSSKNIRKIKKKSSGKIYCSKEINYG
jgi:hypothetical protein